MTTLVTRRAAAGRLFGALAGTGLLLFGQEYGHARDLVARVQEDLERAANFTRNNDKWLRTTLWNRTIAMRWRKTCRISELCAICDRP
jgi:hypothetical protein